MEILKKAIEVMNKPITITKDSSLFEAIKKLVDYKISRVAVLDEGKPVGIITEKDIGIFLYSDKTFQSLEQIPVTELMRTSLLYDGSQTLKECAAIMIEKEVGSLLIGTKEKLKGILTKTDIVNYLGEQYFGKHKVVDLKNPGFVFTLDSAPLSHVLKKMIQNNISRIVVANNSGKLTGIITFRDFFEISLQLGSDIGVTESAALSGHVRKGFLSDEGFGGVSLARDVMTRKILSVSPDNDLASVCQIMVENNLNGLAVIDAKDKKMGIISKTDIIQFFSLV